MRRPVAATLLVVALVALYSVNVRVVHASSGRATAAGSSMVLVAVDATAQSNCKETLHINTGWHTMPPPGTAPLVASTMAIPCAAGTIIKTAMISQAEAVSQREAYVQTPANPLAPTTAEKASINSLVDAKRQALTSRQSAVTQPLTACGATSYANLQWSADNTGFFSVIHWYKYTNCTQVLLDQAELNVGYIWSSQQWEWNVDEYITDSWAVYKYLQSYSSYTYYPNKTEPAGHWYRQQLVEWHPSSTYYDTSIAVCN